MNWEKIKDTVKKVLDFLFWGQPSMPQGVKKITYTSGYPYNDFEPDFSDQRINERLSYWNKNGQLQEYLYEMTGSHIYEPDFGWAIKKGKVIKYSFNNPKMAKPGIFKYIKYRYLNKYITMESEMVVSFRQHAEHNFFHFFSDILPRLWLLSNYNLQSQNFTIIVAPVLYGKEYFQYVLNNSFLKNFRIIVAEKNVFVKAERSYFVVPRFVKREYLLQTAGIFDNIVLKNYNLPQLFIYRDLAATRALSNNSEVMNYMRSRNFHCLNFDKISFYEQLSFIKRAKTVVFVHGAAMINIVFNENYHELNVLEIIPEDRICSEFYWMCSELEVNKHEYLVSGRLDENDQSWVDIKALNTALNQLIN